MGGLALSLLGGSSFTPTGVSADVLAAWASARAARASGAGSEAGADPNAPVAPWTQGFSRSTASLQALALSGRSFFEADRDLYGDVKIGEDYRRLFALYQGVRMMGALAERAETKDITAGDLARTKLEFARGIAEMQSFFAATEFDKLHMVQGSRLDEQRSTLAARTPSADYVTGRLVKGNPSQSIPGLARDAEFSIAITGAGGSQKTVAIDLGEMGALPRSLSGIVSFVNQKLQAAGVATRLETVNLAPKSEQVKIGGVTETRAYKGQGEWAIRVAPKAGETVSFSAPDAAPAFYALGATSNGAGRLVKLQDTSGADGEAVWLERPQATSTPIGPYATAGYLGAGEGYGAAPAQASETRTAVLTADGTTLHEPLLRKAGELSVQLSFPDGRKITVTTGWRAFAEEGWRTRAGETEDQSILSDLAQRVTQLLHEQGVAAGAHAWTDADTGGLSLFAEDGVRVESVRISSQSVALSAGRDADGGFLGGLRGGVAARRFEVAQNGAVSGAYIGAQSVALTTARGAKTVSVTAPEAGWTAGELAAAFNAELKESGLPAAFVVADVLDAPALRIDATHEVQAASVTVNGTSHTLALQAPGAFAEGGLPIAGAGAPFGDARRVMTRVGASPFVAQSGALDLSFVFDSATGAKTVNVAISAQERIDHPDASVGVLNAALQAKIDAALNAAGVYASASGGELATFTLAEDSAQRLALVTVNGGAVAYEAQTPAFGLGGAFGARRSFTSSQLAGAGSDIIAALSSTREVSVTLRTAWGERQVSATLDVGDAADLDSAALRLNEALAREGYDLGVAVAPLSGGGVGLQFVTGASNSVRGLAEFTLGGTNHAVGLDPVDGATFGDDVTGARVASRAARGAAVTERKPVVGAAPFSPPAFSSGLWFDGRSFDISIGQGATVLATRAAATGPDGSVYVLADVAGAVAGQPVAGQRDVALLKLDSAGQLRFARTLGAAEEAQGFTLAAGADGRVAVAGAVRGALAGAEAGSAAQAAKLDSFVTMFEADGREAWTQRRGAAGDDKITALSFTPTGALIAAGSVSGAMPGGAAQGGDDAYVRGFSAQGSVLFTQQFGGGGNDGVSALLVRDAGGGAIDFYTAGKEGDRGVVRAFSYGGTSGLTQGASRDLGNFREGQMSALAHDGTALFVGGSVLADRLSIAETARAGAAGLDGFVARLDDDLLSTGQDRVSYLGSAGKDGVTGLAFVSGALYAMGASNGVLAGAGAAGEGGQFVARLNAEGEASWVRRFTASGRAAPTALAVDASGASALDRLGLPRGQIKADNASRLIERTALRAGDEFFMHADDRNPQRITIAASETMLSLVGKMNAVMGGAGSASVVREGGLERIVVTARDGRSIAFGAGAAGKDALPGLGLAEGVLAQKTPRKGDPRTFGLGFARGDLSLEGAEAIAKTKSELSAAASIIRLAYAAVVNPNAVEQTEEERQLAARAAQGQVPSYLTAQITNYRTALLKLGGGSGRNGRGAGVIVGGRGPFPGSVAGRAIGQITLAPIPCQDAPRAGDQRHSASGAWIAPSLSRHGAPPVSQPFFEAAPLCLRKG